MRKGQRVTGRKLAGEGGKGAEGERAEGGGRRWWEKVGGEGVEWLVCEWWAGGV